MAERPIILFGQPNKSDKAKRGGGASVFQRPSHARQSQRLAPKMTELQNAVAPFKQSSRGVEAEKTLVFDGIGNVDNFYTAVKKFGDDAEWIFDMSDDFEAEASFTPSYAQRRRLAIIIQLCRHGNEQRCEA